MTISPQVVSVVHTVAQLQEAGGALASIVVEVKLLEGCGDEVSDGRHHLPPAGDVAAPQHPRGVQPGRGEAETVPRKYFSAAAHRALPGERGGEAGQLPPVIGFEEE